MQNLEKKEDSIDAEPVLNWEGLTNPRRGTSVILRSDQPVCYTQRSDVRTQEVDGEILVLDDQNGYIHQLNDTAGFVWLLCDGKTTKSDIVRRVVEAFEVDDAVADKDVTEIIDRLRDLNLLSE